MAFGFLGYLAKKLFGGGDDEDRGSSSSSSSYSEPVRYEAPQRVYAAEQKQTYSPPQQKISYEESKPTYSYVDDSPRTTTSGGNRPSYSSFDEDIFGDNKKEPEKKKTEYKRNENEPSDWFFPNLLGQYKKLGKGEEQYDAAGNGYKVNIPYQKGWKFEDYRNAAYNQAWDNYKKSWEDRYSDEQIVEMVQASQMLNYNRQKREKQEAYNQKHAGENKQKVYDSNPTLAGQLEAAGYDGNWDYKNVDSWRRAMAEGYYPNGRKEDVEAFNEKQVTKGNTLSPQTETKYEMMAKDLREQGKNKEAAEIERRLKRMKPNILEEWMNIDPNENALLTSQDQYSKNRLIFNALEGLDRITGAASIRNTIDKGLERSNKGEDFWSDQMWDDAGDGFTGKVKAHGSDIIEKAGWKTGNKYVDFATGLVADIGLDPTTYVGAGLAKQAGKLGSKLGKTTGIGEAAAQLGDNIKHTNVPGLNMSVDEAVLTQASRGGTLKFDPASGELVRAESGVLDDALKDVNQFQNQSHNLLEDAIFQSRKLNKDGAAVGADIEGTYLTQKLNDEGKLQSYSAPELRAEYEPVVDAMGNRLDGLNNDLDAILNPTNTKPLETPITPVKKETEISQIDPDLKHLPEEQQIQIMKQRKTYDEELAAYNHLQDSIKKSYDARINSPDSTSPLEVFQRSIQAGLHPEEMLAAWNELKSPHQLDFLAEAHAHNKFQDDVIEAVRKDFAPLKQDQEAEHMANLAYLEQKMTARTPLEQSIIQDIEQAVMSGDFEAATKMIKSVRPTDPTYEILDKMHQVLNKPTPEWQEQMNKIIDTLDGQKVPLTSPTAPPPPDIPLSQFYRGNDVIEPSDLANGARPQYVDEQAATLNPPKVSPKTDGFPDIQLPSGMTEDVATQMAKENAARMNPGNPAQMPEGMQMNAHEIQSQEQINRLRSQIGDTERELKHAQSQVAKADEYEKTLADMRQIPSSELKNLPPDQKVGKIMQLFTDANKPLLDYLDSVGLSQKEIMGYMPHVMTKEFVDKIERAIPRAVNEKSVNGRSKYVGSVSEINAREGEQVFNNNYYVAMRDKMNDLVRYASSKKMSDHVFKNPEIAVPYSNFEKAGKEIPKHSEVINTKDFVYNTKAEPNQAASRTDSLYVVPKEVANVMRRFTKEPEEMNKAIKFLTDNKFLRGYDFAMKQWKKSALASFATSAREGIGSAFMNYLVGMPMHKVMTGGAAATKVLFKPTGQMKAYGEMSDAARAFVDNGLGKSSLAHLTKDEKFYDPLVGAKGIAGKFDKATDIAAAPFFKGSEVMNMTNQFAYFEYKAKQLAKETPDLPMEKIYQNAAMEVKKIHFDYNDLSKLERKTMGRIIPFYEYNRMVLPAMLKGFAQRPDRLTKTAHTLDASLRDLAGVEAPEQMKPHQSQFGTVIGVGPNRVANINLPTGSNAVTDTITENYQHPLKTAIVDNLIQGQNAFQNPIRKDRTRIEEAARTLTGQIPYYKDRIQEAQDMPLEEALFHVPIGNFVNETKSKQDAFKQRQKGNAIEWNKFKKMYEEGTRKPVPTYKDVQKYRQSQ
ncbi:hypothetical protein E8M24_18810 [Bacillus thuringiensis]|uniref:hypothetical protein n=1 Tax=Bacillus thuringiensis TaxID=1428 RepID=UPI00125F09C5|nr:hypothetical protein [Bacillus thuringiensis]KAB5644645.1 hypothetical protein E8M24_18810 [Bacillus thuringiensis]HDR5269509.1 hypothetical protein [Bacillus thuringiensis]